MGRQDYVEVNVEVQHATERALLVHMDCDEDMEVWIPKSCIDDPRLDELEDGDVVDLLVAEWKLKDMGYF